MFTGVLSGFVDVSRTSNLCLAVKLMNLAVDGTEVYNCYGHTHEIENAIIDL